MPKPEPRPLTHTEQRARRARAVRIAQHVGFVGRVELLDRGQSVEAANRQLQQLWDLLEALL